MRREDLSWEYERSPTEDNVLAIEPRGDDSGNEELRAIGVLASVGHALDMVSLKKFFEISDFKKRVTY